MNYTIIGHSEDTSYFGRCEDYVPRNGRFETWCFRESEKTIFLETWARAKFFGTFDTLTILLNGIDDLDDAELEVYNNELLPEMELIYDRIKLKHEEQQRIEKEAKEAEAFEKIRQKAAEEFRRDMQKLEELKRKLGLT
jgi:CRISPR/Cas system CSM-associated protein Csm5 (group 7 of RAMP superfamily)